MLNTILFTPGPINTSTNVKKQQLIDVGTRTTEAEELTNAIRLNLCSVANCGDEFTCVPIQGATTFALESMLISLTDEQEQILVLSNGLYGDRLFQILNSHSRKTLCLNSNLSQSIPLEDVRSILNREPGVQKIALVHFETSTGVLNDLNGILDLAYEMNCEVLVDATSSFGAVAIDFTSPALLAVTASINKCLHSIPGFGFVFVKLSALLKDSVNPNLFSLNLFEQWLEFERSSQWRFTPPIQSMMAAKEAIYEYQTEGGLGSRWSQYNKLNDKLIVSMNKLSITPLISKKYRAPMVTLFSLPLFCKITANDLIKKLEKEGIVIYSGHSSFKNSFRIGCIGLLNISDIDLLSNKMGKYINE